MQRLLLILFAFVPPLLASPVDTDSLGTIIRSLGVPGITAALLWNLLARSDKRYEALFARHQQMHETMLQVIQQNSQILGEIIAVHNTHDRPVQSHRPFMPDVAGRD